MAKVVIGVFDDVSDARNVVRELSDAGFDRQDDLTLAGLPGQGYSAWTLDAFFDHPLGRGALTVEGAVIEADGTPLPVAMMRLAPGDDHHIVLAQAGWLFPEW